MNASLMDEEIFGPILPIIPFTSTAEVLRIINSRPSLLRCTSLPQTAPSVKRSSARRPRAVFASNDCIMQFTHPGLPFGGVNHSGMGKSHGRFGFLAFSNEKPVLTQKRGFAAPYLLYPPYKPAMKRIIDILLRWF